TAALEGLPRQSAVTGSDGQATLLGLGPGDYTLEVSSPGYGTAFLDLSTAGIPGTTEVRTVALSPGAEVSGVVLGPDGAPAPDARVFAEALSAAPPRGSAFGLPGQKSFGEASVLSDASGRFVFPAVSAGTYRFRATHPSLGPGASPPLTLDGHTPKGGVE